MSRVGIVTDTTSCLPPELVKEYDIRIVPVGLVIGGKHYQDTDLTNEEFWQFSMPPTAQPAPLPPAPVILPVSSKS